MVKNNSSHIDTNIYPIKTAHVLLNQASDFIRYTNRISDENKIKIVNQLQPSFIDGLKILFRKKYLPLNMPKTKDQLKKLLSLHIDDENVINDIVDDYKNDISYRKKINRQNLSNQLIINTNELLSQLSTDAKSHLYSANKKHSLPLSDLAVMASTAKKCQGTAQTFVLSYLPMIIDIVRNTPSSWHDIVNIVRLSYKYDMNNINTIIHDLHKGEPTSIILSELEKLEKEFLKKQLIQDQEE